MRKHNHNPGQIPWNNIKSLCYPKYNVGGKEVGGGINE